jgi:hypothetical protein
LGKLVRMTHLLVLVGAMLAKEKRVFLVADGKEEGF